MIFTVVFSYDISGFEYHPGCALIYMVVEELIKTTSGWCLELDERFYLLEAQMEKYTACVQIYVL